MFIGALMLCALVFVPQYAYPFQWLWLFLLVDPLNALRDDATTRQLHEDRAASVSLIAQFARGELRWVGALALGTLICAFFWELWNFYSYPKWYYTVPYVGFVKIFEMPLLGYIGYIPFGWELYALYHFVVGALKRRSVLEEGAESWQIRLD
jgi:hypothetical protein